MAMEALTMAKQRGKQRSCCSQPYNTVYYPLHSVYVGWLTFDAVDFGAYRYVNLLQGCKIIIKNVRT